METLKGETEYRGKQNFVPTQVVNDNGFITANETAALDFATEIIRTLGADSEAEIVLWHDKHKNGMY